MQYVQLVKSFHQYFRFFRKELSISAISELGLGQVNHEFLNSSIFEKKNSMLWLTFHIKFCEMGTNYHIEFLKKTVIKK